MCLPVPTVSSSGARRWTGAGRLFLVAAAAYTLALATGFERQGGPLLAIAFPLAVALLGDPLDVYDAPSDRFVGGFIGSPPMNFIDADDFIEMLQSAGEENRLSSLRAGNVEPHGARVSLSFPLGADGAPRTPHS